MLSVSLLSLSLCPCSCRRPTSCGFSVSGPYLAELCGAQSGSCWELLWRYCCWCWLTHTRDTWSVFSLLCSFCFSLARLLPRTHMCAHQINCKFSPHNLVKVCPPTRLFSLLVFGLFTFIVMATVHFL